MPTTWTSATAGTTTYVDGDPYSLWDAHDWDEFNWDGTGTLPTWTSATAGTTTWS